MAGAPHAITVPPIWAVRLAGTLPPWVDGHDLARALAGRLPAHGPRGAVLEYAGPGVGALPQEARFAAARAGEALGAAASLFPSSLGIEIQPNQVASVGDIQPYQTSTPCGGPQSYSPLQAPSGMPAKISSSVLRFRGFGGVEGVTRVMLPVPFAIHSIGSPTGRDASATSSSGISTVSVLPTRTIWVVIGLAPDTIILRIVLYRNGLRN